MKLLAAAAARWTSISAAGVLIISASVEPGAASTPFVNETADGSANNVGEYTSLALDASGNPHVSYYDLTAGDLKYARRSGAAWTRETADGSANDVGWYTSLALDASGNPHVTYTDGETSTTFDLKYARKTAGVWTRETADGSANDLGFYTALALDASGSPHVSYLDFTTGDLKYGRKSGGVWTIETADGSANVVGGYTSIALDASGNPHVSYHDFTTGDLKYARKSGGVWTRETADGSANNVGTSTSLALDAAGNPHVSYQDVTVFDLKYARKSGGAWTIETADGSAINVGFSTSIALDALGNPQVSYFDATAGGDLQHARKSGGAWTRETADASANFAINHNSLALDVQGNPHVCYYDATTGDLKYAHAAVRTISPGAGVTWAVGSLQNISWGGIGPVEVLLSLDGGRTFDTLIGSVTENTIALRVPHAPTQFARVRIQREEPFSTSDTDSFFAIDATIALAKFEAMALAKDDPALGGTGVVGDGNGVGSAIRLVWDTAPRPPTIAGCRVERAPGVAGRGAMESNGGEFEPIHPGILQGSELIDRDAGDAPRYRLIAVNGLDEEYVLGETRVAARLGGGRGIVVQPNPAPGGRASVAFRVPTDPLFDDAEANVELAVYDMSGRRVRTLVSGRLPAGVESVAWDGRDDSGRDVGAGVYVLRLAASSGFRASQRVTVVR